MDHEYFIEGVHLPVPRDAQEFVTALGKEFPAENEPITEFFEQMKHVYREMYSDIDKTGGVPTYPRTVEDLLAYSASHPHAMRWMDRPFSEMLDTYFKDVRLKKLLTVLTGYLSDDPTVLTTGELAPIFGYYFDGGYYPAGGSQVPANALVRVIERHEGHLHLRTPVEHIIVDDGRATGVRLASGDVHHAKAIISDADLRRTFLDLVGSDRLPLHFGRQLEALQPSTSAFIVFLGLDFVPEIA
jgi:phytoene dehydrogenase-like protein